MADQITNYQCPACTGPLQFDASSGKLSCEYCGSSYPVAEIEALYAKKDEKAAENMAQADAEREKEEQERQEQMETAAEGDWDMSGFSDDWGTDADGMRSYSCPSCGAELICDETTAATSCPYCGNPTIVPGQFRGTLRPDLVIPFKLKKEDAVAALKKHYEGKKLLPNSFKANNHLEEIQGVYVPFWLFDGESSGEMSFACTRSRTFVSGNYRVTQTDHYNVFRAGKMSFRRIPVDGSKKMADDYMESIEPFNYGDLTDFSTAYLPGYLADKYDVSAEESGPRADERAKASMETGLEDTVRGYGTVHKRKGNIRIQRGEVKYALLPVWMLTTKWEGKNYMFAMNGQTGKMVGDLPIDKKKRRRIFAAVYGIAAAATALLVLLAGGMGL